MQPVAKSQTLMNQRAATVSQNTARALSGCSLVAASVPTNLSLQGLLISLLLRRGCGPPF
jgi:uroporphyrinogen-III synthase